MIPAVVKASKVLIKPPPPLEIGWSRIAVPDLLPRSSHTLSVVDGRAYIFGGEVRPREPVDNTMHVYTLPSSAVAQADYQGLSPQSTNADHGVPEARLGHTAAVIGSRIYIFGGRSGREMKALEEGGRVWVFHTRQSQWESLDAKPNTPFPPARSYHASASSEHPLPKSHESVLHPMVADNITGKPEPLGQHGTLFVHAGCGSPGNRLSDSWAFDIATRTWSRLPDAPVPARGGASLIFAQQTLYRFGGFDGTNELGGQLDYLDMTTSSSDSTDCVTLSAASDTWQSFLIPNGESGPGPRSVAGFHRVTTGQGRSYLLLCMGERSPSTSGHEAAGRFWGDVWSFQLKAEGLTGARLKDVARKAAHRETGEETWAEARIVQKVENEGERSPRQRGWFASSVMDIDPSQIVIWGGIDSDNDRLGDGWILSVK